MKNDNLAAKGVYVCELLIGGFGAFLRVNLVRWEI